MIVVFIIIIAIAMTAMSSVMIGIPIGLVVSLYTLRSAFSLPGAVEALLGVSPVFYLLFHIKKLSRINLRYYDWALVIFLSYTCINTLLRISADYDSKLASFLDMMAILSFYICGRLFGYTISNYSANKKYNGAEISIQLYITLFLVPLSYIFSVNLLQMSDRQSFDGAQPVGLSYAIEILMVCSFVIMYGSFFDERFRNFTSLKIRALIFLSSVATFVYSINIAINNGSRGALISSVASIALIFVFRLIYSIRSSFLLIIPIVFSLAISLYFIDDIINMYPYGADDRFYRALVYIGNMVQGNIGNTEDVAISERIYVHSKALDFFLESPFFGCSYLCTIDNIGIYPHNIFLEIAAEEGVVGLILFGVVIFSSIYKALIIVKNRINMDHVMLSLIFISSALHYQFSFTLPTSRILFLLAGICLSFSLDIKRVSNEPTTKRARDDIRRMPHP